MPYILEYEIINSDLDEPISNHLPIFYKNDRVVSHNLINVRIKNTVEHTNDENIPVNNISVVQVYYDPDVTRVVFPKTYVFRLDSIKAFNFISCYKMFEGCSIISPLPFMETDNVTNMDKMFKDCKLLEEVSNLNTKNVTSMSEMFSGCNNLLRVLDFDTKKVTDMSKMFFGCESLEELPNFNLSKVTKMDFMYTQCINMKGFVNELEYWKNENVNTYQFCFSKCSLLENYRYIPLEWGGLYEEFKGDLPTEQTEYALEYNLKTKCPELLNNHLPLFYINGELSTYEEIFIFLDDDTITTNIYTPLNIIKKISMTYSKNTTRVSFEKVGPFVKEINYIDTRNFTSMRRMFLGCSKIKTVPILNTDKVIDMCEMFKDCNELEVIPKLNTSSVMDTSSMFFKCYKIKSVPNLDTSRVIDASYMFYYCTSLELIPDLDTSNFMHVYYMFENCYNMKGSAYKSHYWENPNIQTIADIYVNCFKKCTSLDNYRYIPLLWGGLGEKAPEITGTYELEYEVLNNNNRYVHESFPEFYEGVSTTSTANKVDYEYAEITLLNGKVTDNINTFMSAVKSVKLKFPEKTSRVNFKSKYISKINFIDSAKFISCHKMFENCINLESIELFDTSNVIDMDYMFYGCEKLTTIPEFNTDNTTEMLGMFYGCSSLRSIPEINTSNVKTLKNMFYGCKNLIMIPNINVDKLVEASHMFYDCSSLMIIPTLDMKNITNIDYIFYNCTNLILNPLINIENITSISHSFYNCKNMMRSIPDFNYELMKNVEYAFYGCSNILDTANPELFWKNENIEEYYYCFKDCSGLTNYKYIPEDWGGLGLPIPDFDPDKEPGEPGTFMMQYEVSVPTSLKLEDYLPIFELNSTHEKPILDLLVTRKDNSTTHQYEYMDKILKVYIRFSRNVTKISFKKLDKYLIRVDYIDTSELVDFSEMFYNCSKLESIPYLVTTNAIDMSYMFYRCFKLRQVPNMDTSNVINTKGMFYKCASLEYNPIMDLTNVEDASYMFCYCVNMEVINAYNTVNIINMEGMYYNCHNISNIPLLDTSNCENLSFMFYGCNKLIAIPNLDAPNVIDVRYMFYDCQKLASAPYLINSHSIQHTKYMFYNCKEMVTALEFNTENVTDMSYMFYNCINMINVPVLDTKNVNSMSYMFYNCSSMSGVVDNDYYWDNTKVKYHYKTFTNCTSVEVYNQIPTDWK